MSNRIRVVVKRPMLKPYIVELGPKAFESVQNLVAAPTQRKGYVETTPFNLRVAICVNEDGIAHGLPTNFMWNDNILLGTAVFVRFADFAEDDFPDLEDRDIADIIKHFIDFEGLRTREEEDEDVDRCFACHMLLDGSPHDCDMER